MKINFTNQINLVIWLNKNSKIHNLIRINFTNWSKLISSTKILDIWIKKINLDIWFKIISSTEIFIYVINFTIWLKIILSTKLFSHMIQIRILKFIV